MTEELIKRLRAIEGVAFVHAGQVGIEDAAICHEAADTIEAQAAEIKRLRGIVVNYVEPFDVTPDDEVFVEAVQGAALGETE